MNADSRFRFIHCSDVHLGTGRQVHPERYLDFFRVFEEVIDRAITENVHALFIAGDLFDTKEPDVETLSRAVAILKKLKDASPTTEVLAIEGNHDMRKRAIGVYRNEQGALDVLASAGLMTVLRPALVEGGFDFEPATARLAGGSIAVLGLGYDRDRSAQRFNDAMTYCVEHLANPRVIVLAHMMIMPGGLLFHGAVRPEELAPVPDNVHYVGLGHGHRRLSDLPSLRPGLFHAPGSLEFVHARNVKQDVTTRGYVLAELGGDNLAAAHQPTLSKRPFIRIKMTCQPDQHATFEDLIEQVAQCFDERLPEGQYGAILCLELEGRLGFPGRDFRKAVIERQLKERFHAIQVMVERQELRTADGEPLLVEVMDDYSIALTEVLQGLAAESAKELGLPADDTTLVECLQNAIDRPKQAAEELGHLQAHIAAHRALSRPRSLNLTLTGQPLQSVAATVQAAALEEPARLLSVNLMGRPTLDADGLPVFFDLEALREAVGDEARVIFKLSPELFDPTCLMNEGGNA